MGASSIFLIRHCESTGQAPDARLTEAGTKAAVALQEILDRLGIDAVYSSPFRRALETVAPYAESRKLTVGIDERFSERRLSPLPLTDWLDHIQRSFLDFDYRVAGGESMREAQARGIAALGDVASASHRAPAVSMHGNLLSAILCSIDETFGFGDWQKLKNPEIFRVRWKAGRPTGFNRLEISIGSERMHGVVRQDSGGS